MLNSKQICTAIRIASQKLGNQSFLAKRAGIAQGRISDFLHSRRDVMKITLDTFVRLFPEAEVSFFGEESCTNSTKQEVNQHHSSESSSSLQKALQEAESKKHEYEKKLAELEKERHIFELEKENWKLKRDLEEARDAEMKRGMRSPFSRQ